MKPYSIERRDLLRHACCGVAGLAVGLGMPHAFAATDNRTELTPDQVLALLKEGNEHFVVDQASTAQSPSGMSDKDQRWTHNSIA